jgi:hypothetical protein
MQCTYDIILRHIPTVTVAKEKQLVVHNLSVCICNTCYPTCNAHVPYCHLWPTLLYNIFPHYLTSSIIFRGKEKKSYSTQNVCFDSLHNKMPETFLKTKCLLTCIFYTIQTKYPPHTHWNFPTGWNSNLEKPHKLNLTFWKDQTSLVEQITSANPKLTICNQRNLCASSLCRVRTWITGAFQDLNLKSQ